MKSELSTTSTDTRENMRLVTCNNEPKRFPIAACLAVLLIMLVVASFAFGRYPVGIADVLHFLITGDDSSAGGVLKTVVYQIRLPRIMAAIMVGAGLSVAGTAFQGLFRNPIASPDILGVASGAGFGAALGIIRSGNVVTIQTLAFVFGLAAVGLVYMVSRVVKGSPTLTLILGGLAVGGVFNALLALLKYAADPVDQLPSIVFWLMGSMASVDNRDLLFAAVPVSAGMGVLLLIRWRLNIMAMGEDEAMSLGLDTKRYRFLTVVCATLVTASVVCISGIIGWIGLVIPHMGRMIAGPCHRRLLPVTTLLGAVYLLFIDNIARTATTVEIPIGILTAIVGAPFFLYLIGRDNRGWV